VAWLLRLLGAVFLLTAVAPASRASIFSLLEDGARMGGRAGEASGYRVAAGGGQAAFDGSERAAAAAAILSAAGAAAFLTSDGGEFLLYLSGARGPISLLGVTGDNLRQLPGLMTRKISDALPGVGRRDLVLDSVAAAAVAPDAAALVRDFHLSVSDPAYGVRPVSVFGPPGAETFLVSLKPGLAVRLEDAAISAPVRDLFGTKLNSEQVRVMVMVSDGDPDTLAGMLEVGRDRVVAAGERAMPGRFSLTGFEDGVAILIGHVEDDAFVLSPAIAGEPALRVEFSAIEAEAARTRSTVLYVGCETFGDTTRAGFLKKIRDSEAMLGLKRSLGADTYEDLLSGLGTPENPFVVVPDHLQGEADRVTLRAQRLDEHRAVVDGGARVVRLGAMRRAPAAASGPGILGGAAVLYLLGMVPAAFGFRMSRATYVRQFPSLPNKRLRPTEFTIGNLIKWTVFLALLPFSALMVVFLLLLGAGWSNREEFFALFWSLFLKPLHFLATILCTSFLLIVRFTIMGCGIAVFASCGQVLFGAAQRLEADAASVVVSVVLVIAGGALLIFLWPKAGSWAEAWLNLIIKGIANRAVRLAVIALPLTLVAVAATVFGSS
jgi:hypothetical protein